MPRPMLVFAGILAALAAALAAGCGGGDGGVRATPQPLFSFVVLADPHVSWAPDAAQRLEACIDWIEANRDARAIEVVLVVGDLGTPGKAKQVLDGLDVPWVPVIGDNVIQGGGEATFDATFEPQYDALATDFPTFVRSPTPVPNGAGDAFYLQNFSFDHGGVHFIGLDWCTRTIGGATAEQADLHDFPGGTLPFLAADLAACPKDRLENVVLLSHHPMHDVLDGAGSFSPGELDAVEATTAPYADHVVADFAGHYHFAWKDRENAGGFEVFVSDAVWDDDATLRLVTVLDDGTRLQYAQEVVTVVAAP
ncbi:MAG: metallophosphoesterase [Planctomycetota bacterium]